MSPNDIRVGFSLNSADYNTIKEFSLQVLEALKLPELLFLRKIADSNYKLVNDGSAPSERDFLHEAGLVDSTGIFLVPTFHGSLVITQLLKQGKGND